MSNEIFNGLPTSYLANLKIEFVGTSIDPVEMPFTVNMLDVADNEDMHRAFNAVVLDMAQVVTRHFTQAVADHLDTDIDTAARLIIDAQVTKVDTEKALQQLHDELVIKLGSHEAAHDFLDRLLGDGENPFRTDPNDPESHIGHAHP